ncbi:hypothetical protein ACX0G7_18785 [Flavitalea antarctica]
MANGKLSGDADIAGKKASQRGRKKQVSTAGNTQIRLPAGSIKDFYFHDSFIYL